MYWRPVPNRSNRKYDGCLLCCARFSPINQRCGKPGRVTIQYIRHTALFAFGATMLLLASCAALTPYQGTKLISLQAQIEIDAPVERVFAFATDVRNEHLWRSEVIEIVADGPLRMGAGMVERLALGAVRGYVTRVRVTALIPNAILRVEAAPRHPRRFIAERRFERLGANRTRLTYLVRPDIRILSDLWPFPLAPGVAKAYYELRMHRYLAELKRLLEAAERNDRSHSAMVRSRAEETASPVATSLNVVTTV